MSTLNIDLARKYSRPGPRYTSYPTAPQFSETLAHDVLIEQLQAGSGPLSLYFHLPFCEQLCWFCGCTKVITRKTDIADRYLDAIEKEVELTLKHLKPGRKVTQLHFGGGTPNYLTPVQLQRLGTLIHQHFDFDPESENSVEMDPRQLTREHIEAFHRMGIRRASFGVQDVNPDVQKAIHRVQSMDANRNAINWLREFGFHSFNIDLIYGLPKQTPESFRHTVQAIIELEPDRLAVFSYAHVPWINPAQKILEAKHLPDPEAKLQMLASTVNLLTNNGYAYIGMDHFAKKDDELATSLAAGTLHRNFQGYSTRLGAEMLGFGMSSISMAHQCYRQNVKSLEEYYTHIEAGKLPWHRGVLLSQDDILRREVIMHLMCRLGVDYHWAAEHLKIKDFKNYFADALEQLAEMEDDKLVERHEDKLLVTDSGRYFIRNIAMCFDAYLQTGNARYSKTV